jgi:hypothetical protein
MSALIDEDERGRALIARPVDSCRSAHEDEFRNVWLKPL